MSITFVGAGAATENTTAGTSLVLPYPAGILAGDSLVMLISTNSPSAVPVNQSGYTTIAAFGNTGTTVLPTVYAGLKKTTSGSESGNLNAVTTNTTSIGQLLCFRGVDQTTPQDTAATTLDKTVASGTEVLPALTTTMPGCALIALAACSGSGANYTPPTAPGTFIETFDRVVGSRPAEGAYLIWSGSGSTGTVTMNHSANSGKGCGVLLALRPAIIPFVGWGIPL